MIDHQPGLVPSDSNSASMTSYRHDWPWSPREVRHKLLRLGLLLVQQHPCTLPALNDICVSRSQPYRRAVGMLMRFAPALFNANKPWRDDDASGCWVAAKGPFEAIEAAVRAACLRRGLQVLYVTRHDKAPVPVLFDHIEDVVGAFDALLPIQHMHSDRLSLHDLMSVLADLKQLIDDHRLTDIITVHGTRLCQESAYVDASNILDQYQVQVVQGGQCVCDVALVGFWVARNAEATDRAAEVNNVRSDLALSVRECGADLIQISRPGDLDLFGPRLHEPERSEIVNDLLKGGLS